VDEVHDLSDLFAKADKGGDKDQDSKKSSDKSKKKRVLLADDSLMVRKKMGAVLRQLGCEVDLAEDGTEALGRARTHPPALIILDVMMPEKDGLDTLAELRADQRLKDIPVLMLTSKADGETVSRALSGQVVDYILKNSSPVDLLKRLRKQVDDLG
jgi:CheY-like chemotaxis protein